MHPTAPESFNSDPTQGIATVGDWRAQRRPQLLQLFPQHIYGRTPETTLPITARLISEDPGALSGSATRREVTLFLTGAEDGPSMTLLIYIPNGIPTAVPAFLGLNFYGNHSIHSDPAITLSPRWMLGWGDGSGVVNHRATEASRGYHASRWPVEQIIASGYALVTAYYGDIEPDYPDGWRSGIRAAFGTDLTAPDAWGAIGAWAWSLSRALDYLHNEPRINPARVALIGHSRLGKTALWAGAQDERFPLVISIQSGKGGAALAKRRQGEQISDLIHHFPYWFCPRFAQYATREQDLPVDAHHLIALLAPRPTYISSATLDTWCDPEGEFTAARLASAAYHLYGLAALDTDTLPLPDSPTGDFIRYHIRTGAHEPTAFDWTQYLAFADRHLKAI